MKNNIIFILIAGSIFLFSCGTMNKTSYTSSNFVNGIYYNPEEEAAESYSLSKAELENLSKETALYLDTRPNEKPGDTLFNQSYETYVSLNLDYIHPEWYTWYQPAWSTYRTAWHNPYWGFYYSGWDPYYWNRWNSWNGVYSWSNWYSWNSWYGWSIGGWHNRWHLGWHLGWYDPWWDFPPYYAHHYWPWHRPGYNPPLHGHNPRDIYYGPRNSSPSYRANVITNNRGSSYTRRDSDMNPINGTVTQRPDATPSNNKGSSYRRSASQYQNTSPEKNSGSYQQNNGEQRSNSGYSRGSNYNRNGSSYNSNGNGSRSSGSMSTGRNSSSGSGYRSSGGSSYRR